MRKRIFAAASMAVLGLCVPTRTYAQCPGGVCPATFQPVGTARVVNPPIVGRPTVTATTPVVQAVQPVVYYSAPVVQPQVSYPTMTATVAQSGTGLHELAVQKAQVQATRGVMGHLTPTPAGLYGGVGFSTYSPQDALSRCCFTGQRVPVAQAVVPRVAGGRILGWYAAKLFR